MIRIQRKRTKGWRMPEGAVYVGRGTPWGNPFTVAEYGRETAVALYRDFLALIVDKEPDHLEPLRGHDLACWCPLYFEARGYRFHVACHADVIIEWFHRAPVLPGPGERLTFGVHRQLVPDAETAPAWAPDDPVARFTREQRAFAKSLRQS